MRVTIKDIAKEAKVSVCTVSHVLNNTPGYKVKPETRALVLKTAQRLNYQPNMIARGLVKKRSYLVGVVVNRVTIALLPETLQGIEAVADDLGYSILLYTHMWSPERERKYLKGLLQKGVDGIIIQPVFPENFALLREVQASVPLVQLHNTLAGLAAPAVVADHVKAGRLATEHLIRLGHRRIAHLRGAGPHGEMRYQGYREVLAAHGIPEAPDLVLDSTWEWESGRDLTLRLLNGPERPTAIFACSDLVAWGAIKAAATAGFSVPQDLAIIGVDDIPIAPLMEVPLTTVALPMENAGRLAMEILHRYIEHGQEDSRVLDVELVVRKSCGAQSL